MDNERIARRTRMLEKVRKLLSMARDGRGNATEEATAMRQANILMAEYGIAEAECDMTAIDAGEMSFGEVQCDETGRAPVAGHVIRKYPVWCGVLAVGVAKFTDSIAAYKQTVNGKVIVFRGEKDDVLLARWLFGVLIHSINAERLKSGWTARSDAGGFNSAAAGALQTRLVTLARERRAMFEQAKAVSNSRALIVVDRKHTEIVKRFGEQTSRTHSRAYSGDSGAIMAGREAGKRLNIPAGRPIGGNTQKQIH